MDVLNSTASICSIVGAIVAWWQYKKTKNASQAAIKAKDFILDRKNTIDLNELLKEAKLIEAMVIGYKINNETSTKGRNKSRDLGSIQMFLSKLNERKAHITTTNELRKKLDERYVNINNLSSGLQNGEKEGIEKLLEEIRILITILSTDIDDNLYSH